MAQLASLATKLTVFFKLPLSFAWLKRGGHVNLILC